MSTFLSKNQQGLRLFFIAFILIASFAIYKPQKPDASAISVEKIQVVAVGDSITYGYGIAENTRNKDSYPAQLQSLLGSAYKVTNYGLNGATLLSDGDTPYTTSNLYKASHRNDSAIVLIMLGTNDSKPQNWNAEKYEAELLAFTNSYKNLETKPRVYLIAPPAAYQNSAGVRPDIIENQVAPIVAHIAEQTDTPLIDVFAATKDHPELFPDGLHPSAAGYQLIAETISQSIL